MKKYLYLLALAMVFVAPIKLLSQTDAAAKTLKGINTLQVEIEPLAADLVNAGVTTEEIRADVETKLRDAGFKIKKPNEIVAPYARLRVFINSIDNGVGGFAVSLTTSLNQLIVLDRDKSIISTAPTWESISIISVIKEKVQGIRKFVNLQTDLFIKSHRKGNDSAPPTNANPK